MVNRGHTGDVVSTRSNRSRLRRGRRRQHDRLIQIERQRRQTRTNGELRTIVLDRDGRSDIGRKAFGQPSR